MRSTGSNNEWERVFAWRAVPIHGYLKDTARFEFVLRRKNTVTGEFQYKKPETPAEEIERKIDFMAW